MDDYRKVLWVVAERLEEAGLPYMVSGSTAMSFYGRPRMTRDIDIVIELDAGSIERMASLFEEDFSVDVEEMRDAVARRSLFNFIHFDTVVKVDLIVRKDLPYRREEFSRRRRFEDQGHSVWVVSPEDLILSKLYWARESRSDMQLGDVRNILGSMESLDWPYLETWAESLGIRNLLEEVRT